MSEVPKNPFREKENHHIATEAAKRKEKRAETRLAILQEQADHSDQDRQSTEKHKTIERKHWRKQAALMKAQLKVARRLNCISITTAISTLFSVLAVLGTVMITYGQLKQSTLALHIDQRAWVAISDWHFLKSASGDPYPSFDFKNTGKTFALKTSAWINDTFTLAQIPDTDDQTKTTNSGVLPPSASNSISMFEIPRA